MALLVRLTRAVFMYTWSTCSTVATWQTRQSLFERLSLWDWCALNIESINTLLPLRISFLHRHNIIMVVILSEESSF